MKTENKKFTAFYGNKDDGFTLVEMVVAMTLFVTIVSAVMALFLRSVQSERGIAGNGSTIGSVSLAIEEMAREMRTASSFAVGKQQQPLSLSNPQCDQAYNSITFTYVNGFGADTTVTYNTSSANGGQIIQTVVNGKSLPMTPAGTNVELRFIVSNFCNGTQLPPRITISAQGSNPANKSTGFTSTFDLETTVSQRLYYYHG